MPEARITNPTYLGRIRWRDQLFDGIHEPLVDELTFGCAQAILRERGEHVSRRRGAPPALITVIVDRSVESNRVGA